MAVSNSELACCYAALLLADDDVPVTVSLSFETLIYFEKRTFLRKAILERLFFAIHNSNSWMLLFSDARCLTPSFLSGWFFCWNSLLCLLQVFQRPNYDLWLGDLSWKYLEPNPESQLSSIRRPEFFEKATQNFPA